MVEERAARSLRSAYWWALQRKRGHRPGDAPARELRDAFIDFESRLMRELEEERERARAWYDAELGGLDEATAEALWGALPRERKDASLDVQRLKARLDLDLIPEERRAEVEEEALSRWGASVLRALGPDELRQRAVQEKIEDLLASGRALREDVMQRAMIEETAFSPRGERTERVDLEAAIESAFDDDAARAVYADYLQSEAHPLGELIALQVALHHAWGSKRDVLRREAQAYLERHERELFGPFARHRHLIRPEWDRGFVVAVAVERTTSDLSPDRMLECLLDLPVMRFVRRLSLFSDPNVYDVWVDVLGRRTRPTIRALALGGESSQERRWVVLPDLTPLEDALPNLEELRVVTAGGPLGRLDFPRLTRLTFMVERLTESMLDALFSVTRPALRYLRLAFVVADHPFRSLIPLLTATRLPGLRELVLDRTGYGFEVVRLLLDSAVIDQLYLLDVSGVDLGIREADLLVDQERRLRGLRRLVLAGNLDPDVQERLRRALYAYDPPRFPALVPDDPPERFVGEIGRWRLAEKIRTGWYGTSWLARREEGVWAIVDLLPVEDAARPFGIDRVAKGPGFLTPVEQDRVGDQLLFAQELWQGALLADRIGALSWRGLALVAVEVCRTLAGPHAEGRAHGAVGIDTIVLSEGRVLLGWFGRAEIVSGAADPREDVRALGKMLQQGMRGAPPAALRIADAMCAEDPAARPTVDAARLMLVELLGPKAPIQEELDRA